MVARLLWLILLGMVTGNELLPSVTLVHLIQTLAVITQAVVVVIEIEMTEKETVIETEMMIDLRKEEDLVLEIATVEEEEEVIEMIDLEGKEKEIMMHLEKDVMNALAEEDHQATMTSKRGLLQNQDHQVHQG